MPLATYVAPGTTHTIVGGDEFYDMEVEGVRLVDWFTAVLTVSHRPTSIAWSANRPP